VPDRNGLVAERGDVGRRHGLLDGGVDAIEVRGVHIALQRRDVRVVGVVQGEPVGHALAQPRVDLAGLLQSGVVGVDQDVDGGEVAHAAGSCRKTVVQSFFMLTTVQPSSMALARDFSAAWV
jgi:hypothetical protein